MTKNPIWTDGQPNNLEAAATDVLKWLDLWIAIIASRRVITPIEEDQKRLRRATEALRRFIQDGEGTG